MTFTSNPIMLIEEESTGNVSTQPGRIQDKHIWKSLRSHIISRREKNKQAEADAEVLRKKKCVEFQKMEENKLSLAQINGRLSALRDRREELEEEKRVLLNQVQATDEATSLIVPKSESNSESLNNKLIITNNINNTAVSHQRSSNLLQPQQHIYRQQTSITAQPNSGSPVAATINAVVANNQNNNSSTRSSISLTSSLPNTMTFTKFSSMYSSSSSHLLPPNLGTSNKLGRTPSPQPPTIQQQSYHQQQPIVVPFPTYKSMNSGSGGSSILNSSTGVVNNINQSIVNPTNNNYSLENINRRGSRDETPSSFSRNVSMWNNNNPNKNTQPNVSIYGSFYQPPSATAVNYCVNNSISSSPSSSSVNTVYSYSGTPPSMSRSESTGIGNLMVTASPNDHGAQISKSSSSLQQQQHHQHHHGHTNPPMYMSPGIRNQTNNHTYHPKPSHSLYGDEKLIPPPTNYYQQQSGRNIHSSGTQSQHQMSQKTHNLNYLRQPSSAASQLSPVVLQPSQHGSYSNPTSSITGYSAKSPGPVTAVTDISRYPHQSQTQSSRDMNN
ncbi:GATA zinc finger domain-containing protein 14-like isoform X2 [Daktulosphaira vitifoliae]|uniref:GATA zinc finger domain-containing protein 14-like isoform X2 n=1 Tax=Daktulosphaira vitifoliae TaxID=58002 RepID=UPI0021A9DDE8|nr:GATA zinc finger domain-containing protein 14-like isoform X2 [Daktulosphaira vitifoliae]